MRFHVSFFDYIHSDAKRAIVRFLLRHTADMSEREIASVLHLPHMRVHRMLQELEEVHFVSFRTIGRAHVWCVHRTSFAFQFFSSFLNTMSKMALPLDALQHTILKKIPRAHIEKVIFFGSVAKGTENVHSDIDVCIIVKNARDVSAIEPWLDSISIDCLELFGNRLAPYVLTRQDMKQKQQLPVIKAIQQGKQIFPCKENTE